MQNTSDDDVTLRRLCREFRTRPAGVRNALTTDDLYHLLAFAQRAAGFAIDGGDAAWLEDGLTAVAMVDDERVDPRDIDPALDLLHYAAGRIGADAGALFAAAAALSTRSVAKRMRGPRAYHPEHDLLRTARELGAMLERDRYRVASTSVAPSLPAVWLSAPLRTPVTGAVTIHAIDRNDPEQIAMLFLAELAGAEAASPATLPDVAIAAVAHGTLLCILVARSSVDGVPSAETSLQRFIEPVRHALSISPVTDAT